MWARAPEGSEAMQFIQTREAMEQMTGKPLVGREVRDSREARALAAAAWELGWAIGMQPRTFRVWLDHTCRFWFDVRRALGLSGDERDMRETRDVHAFTRAAIAAYATAPLACPDFADAERDECMAVASFEKLLANAAALFSLTGSCMARPEAHAWAAAAFAQGWRLARAASLEQYEAPALPASLTA